jgi:hypothetical protein
MQLRAAERRVREAIRLEIQDLLQEWRLGS